MSDYLSKRVKKVFGVGLSSSRYDYLSLEQAEPDLGNPLVGPSSIGAKPNPTGVAYILASFATTSKADRYWVPPSELQGLGLGLIPGAFTIRNEGATVGTANSFTTLNFVGQDVDVDYVGPNPDEQTGIATVRINSKGRGIINAIQYHSSTTLTDGATDFVYDENTNSVGIGTTAPVVTLDVRGTASISGVSTFKSNVNLDDNTSLNIGVGSDFTITHDGTDTNIVSNTGKLNLDSDDLNIAATRTGKEYITAVDGAAVSIFHNGLNDTGAGSTHKRIETSRYGTTFKGSGVFEEGLHVVDNKAIRVGTGTDLTIYHDGTDTYIDNEEGSLYIRDTSNGDVRIQANSGEDSAIFNDDGSVELYHDNVKKFETTGTGATVYGTLESTVVDTGTVSATTVNSSDIFVSGLTTTTDFRTKYANVSTAGTITNFFATHANVAGLTTTTRLYSGKASIGSTLTATHIGINTEPNYPLDVNGEARFGNLIYVSNGTGITGEVLLSQGGSNPPIWGPPTNVTVGSAQSVYIDDVTANQTHFLTFSTEADDTGYIKVDTEGLFYNPSSNTLGIGRTANHTLDVLGDINFTGTLLQNGELGVFSRWTIDEATQDIFRFAGNIGIGTSALSHKFSVLGDTLLEGDTTIRGQIANGLTVSGIATIDQFTSADSNIDLLTVGAGGTVLTASSDGTVAVGIGTTTATLTVTGETILDGVTHFDGTITEKIHNTYGTDIPSTGGKMTLDVNTGTVVVGVLTEAVGEWAFTGVDTSGPKATTMTLIIDSDSLLGYAETCSVNGSAPFGVRWGGGIAPLPTNNEDIISFTIATDSNGQIRVFGSSSLNFS